MDWVTENFLDILVNRSYHINIPQLINSGRVTRIEYKRHSGLNFTPSGSKTMLYKVCSNEPKLISHAEVATHIRTNCNKDHFFISVHWTLEPCQASIDALVTLPDLYEIHITGTTCNVIINSSSIYITPTGIANTGCEPITILYTKNPDASITYNKEMTWTMFEIKELVAIFKITKDHVFGG
jgi:hypothetical protein